MMTGIYEISRSRKDGRYWVVEVHSAAINKWIVQGVYLRKEEAEVGLNDWRAGYLAADKRINGQV